MVMNQIGPPSLIFYLFFDMHMLSSRPQLHYSPTVIMTDQTGSREVEVEAGWRPSRCVITLCLNYTSDFQLNRAEKI